MAARRRFLAMLATGDWAHRGPSRFLYCQSALTRNRWWVLPWWVLGLYFGKIEITFGSVRSGRPAASAQRDAHAILEVIQHIGPLVQANSNELAYQATLTIDVVRQYFHQCRPANLKLDARRQDHWDCTC